MPIDLRIKNKKSLDDLNEDFEEMKLATRAMWELVKERTGLTDRDLELKAEQIWNQEQQQQAPAAPPTPAPEAAVPPPVVQAPTPAPAPVTESVPQPASVDLQQQQMAAPAPPVTADVPVGRPVTPETSTAAAEDGLALKAEPEVKPKMGGKIPIKVELRGDLVKCPICKKVFSVRDSRHWDGAMHIPCETPLIIEGLDLLT